jgi:hypothetical protein
MKKIINLLILSCLFSCNGQKKEDCLISFEKRVAPLQNSKIKQGEIINFKDSINCIEWDSLLVVMAIGSKESVEKSSGIKIPYSYEGSMLYYGDNDAIIFFLKDKVAVNHILIKGSCKRNEICRTYDFLNLMGQTNHAFISKENAVFEVYTWEALDNRGNKYVNDNAIRIKSK